MKNTTGKLVYEAPVVEVMAARIERGFVLSNVQRGGDSTIEEFSESGNALWN